MSGNNGKYSGFTGGGVSGSTVSFYSDKKTNISLSIAAPIGEIVGHSGAYDKDNNHNPEDFNLNGMQRF